MARTTLVSQAELRDTEQPEEEPRVFGVVLLGTLGVAIPYLMLLASFWYLFDAGSW